MNIKLVNGRRYLFYNKEQNHKFRANFIDIISNSDGYKTLRIEKYIYETGQKINSKMITMPLSWINKIETLVDIVNDSNNCIDNNSNNCIDNNSNKYIDNNSNNSNNCIINDDILLEIDLYL
jgi:hypothetical protein